MGTHRTKVKTQTPTADMPQLTSTAACTSLDTSRPSAEVGGSHQLTSITSPRHGMGAIKYDSSSGDGEIRQLMMEQYKLYVTITHKMGDRRVQANAFFVGLNSSLLTAFGALSALPAVGFKWSWAATVSVVGLIMNIIWFLIIRSYGQLAAGKFQVIGDLEAAMNRSLHNAAQLPAPFAREWEVLGLGKTRRLYVPMTTVEKLFALLFGVVHVLLATIVVLNTLGILPTVK